MSCGMSRRQVGEEGVCYISREGRAKWFDFALGTNILTATVEPFLPTPPTTNIWQKEMNNRKNPEPNTAQTDKFHMPSKNGIWKNGFCIECNAESVNRLMSSGVIKGCFWAIAGCLLYAVEGSARISIFAKWTFQCPTYSKLGKFPISP